MTNPNDPATFYSEWVTDKTRIVPGLSKREWFAGLIYQGLVAGEIPRTISAITSEPDLSKTVATMAVKAADALIAELSKDPK